MKKFMFLALMIASMFFVGCDDDDDDGGSGTGTLSVRLTDAPADYDEVWIDVTGIEIHLSGDESDGNGWQSLPLATSGKLNLLDLNNGKDTLLVEVSLDVGTISQMRMALGDSNKVMVDGVYHDLETPSAQQSGLKFNIHATLEEGVIYKMWIDFDAGQSIVEKGNGTYSLKPTIRVFTEADSGAIEGEVLPAEANTYVKAFVLGMTDTLSTYADELTGKFLIPGVPEGTYEIIFTPEVGTPKDTSNVQVTIGEVTDIGTVDLD